MVRKHDKLVPVSPRSSHTTGLLRRRSLAIQELVLGQPGAVVGGWATGDRREAVDGTHSRGRGGLWRDGKG